MTRVLVIGLDALSPDLVERWLPDLPNIRWLMQHGIYGPLQSIVQPVTPVAWSSMVSGRNPSHFGYTDFLARTANSYTDFRLVHARMLQVPTLFSLLGQAGYQTHMVSVPISYPPVALQNGVCLSCFMAPSIAKGVTHPPEMQAQLLAQTTSPFVLDTVVLDGAPQLDRAALLHQIREMDRQRFDIARYLMETTDWDLLFMVAMGTDRVGHYFMRFLDPNHGRYDPDPRYQQAIHDQYCYCDERLGELIELAGPDTVLMVVSDHGIQRLDGKVNLNDWLVRRGYLQLSQAVTAPTGLAKAPVDWSRTQAWAQGYGGQIYLNVRGREPKGVIAPEDVETVLDALEADLKMLTTRDGSPMKVTTLRRAQMYQGAQAQRCPDLYVQFDDLHYLSADSLGHADLVTPVVELGHDDASHANAGFLAMAGPGIPNAGRFEALSLLDVLPTILDLFNVPVPSDLEGRPIHVLDDVYSDEDTAELTNRLRSLYLE